MDGGRDQAKTLLVMYTGQQILQSLFVLQKRQEMYLLMSFWLGISNQHKKRLFSEIGLRCALRTIYGVKKVLALWKCPIV